MWMTNTNFANMYENSIARINLHQKNYKVCYIVYEYEFWDGWCGSILDSYLKKDVSTLSSIILGN